MDLFAQLGSMPSVEVLINFAHQSLNQWFISDQSKHHRVDELFGDEDWQSVFTIPVDEREQFLINKYVQSLSGHGFGTVAFQMINLHNQTQYYLVFGSQHPLGLEYFKEAAWSVAPDGGFSYSDLRDDRQLGFGPVMGREMVEKEISDAVWDAHQGKSVPMKRMLLDVAHHPAALPGHLRVALRQLQNDRPPLIEAVIRPDGSSVRHGAFPDDCLVQFAEGAQSHLF